MSDHSTRTPACVSPPSHDALAVLDSIARRLSQVRPNGAMTPAIRCARALTHTTDRLGYGPHAETVEAEVLDLLPAVDHELTRGQYATLIEQAVKVVRP